MTEMTIAYLIWLACALLFVVLGIIDIVNANKGKVFGFYNISPPPKAEALTDVVAYNRAVGKLLIGSGIIFALLGFPLLLAENNPALIVLVGVLGSIAWVISMVLAYELIIMKKYRKKQR